MAIFYSENISSTSFILNENESKHAIRVLRLKNFDKIEIIDGKGFRYIAEISDANAKRCEISILSQEFFGTKRNYYLHIAIAPPKNIDRFEYFLEKTVEIGIDEITPLLSRYSERTQWNEERLQRIIIESMKQSKTYVAPKLNKFTSFNSLINNDFQGKRGIAFCSDSEKMLLNRFFNENKKFLILIGPEGDFSEEEILAARNNNFLSLDLGENRLRTETAGILVCAASAVLR